MTALLLPFAMRLSDGKLVSPAEVERGQACNCVCPGCNGGVSARQGAEREWHFAHTKGGNCSQGYEVSIHELAKQMLRQRKVLLLPSLIATAYGIDANGQQFAEQEQVLKSQLVVLDDCKTGVNFNDIHVDAIGIRKEHKILIEITVFHRLMPDKQKRIVNTEIPSIQINLQQFKSQQVTKDLLEKAIFEDESNRQWLYHPKHSIALESVKAKLAERLQENKSKWEKEEVIRKENAATRMLQQIADTEESRLRTAFGGSSSLRRGVMFRSTLPSFKEVASSATQLAKRTGLREEDILTISSTYTNRGQLQAYTPEEFLSKWSIRFNLPIKEVEEFLVDAKYLLRC